MQGWKKAAGIFAGLLAVICLLRFPLQHAERQGNQDSLAPAIRQAAARLEQQWQNTPLRILSRAVGPGTVGQLKLANLPTPAGTLNLDVQAHGDWVNRRASLDGRIQFGDSAMALSGYCDQEQIALTLPSGGYSLSYRDAADLMELATSVIPGASLDQPVQHLTSFWKIPASIPALPTLSRKQLELALLALPALESERSAVQIQDGREVLDCTEIIYRLDGPRAAALLSSVLGEGSTGRLTLTFTLWDDTLLCSSVSAFSGEQQLRYTLSFVRNCGPIAFTAVQRQGEHRQQITISLKSTAGAQGQSETLTINDWSISYRWNPETEQVTILPSGFTFQLHPTEQGIQLSVEDAAALIPWDKNTSCILTAAPGGAVAPPSHTTDLASATPADWMLFLQDLAPLRTWLQPK